MGSTNMGSQRTLWRFKTALNSDVLNRAVRNIYGTGVYTGFTITKVTNTSVSIGIGKLIIEDSENTAIIETTEAYVLTVSTTLKYIVARWDYAKSLTNYMDFIAVENDDIQSTDIVLGVGVFSGATLNSISTTGRTVANKVLWDNVVDRFKVTESATPGMTVEVAAGWIILSDGIKYTISATQKTIAAAHATLNRIDLVGIDAYGVLQVVAGTAAASPTAPSSQSYFALAEVYVAATAAAIYSENITDMRSVYTTPFDLASVLDYTDVRYYNVDDSNRKEDRLKYREEHSENRNLEQDIELSYLENRQINKDDQIVELFIDRNNFDEDFETTTNKVAEIFDDIDFNNNWKESDARPAFKNGFIRPKKMHYMGELMEEFDLTNIGQTNKCAIEYDATNSCYWLMTNAGANGIGEIVKLSKYMTKGKVEVMGHWYLPVSGSNKYWTGICTGTYSASQKLWIVKQGNGSVESSIFGFTLNDDGTIGVDLIPSGQVLNLTTSPYTPEESSLATEIWSDIINWNTADLMVLLNSGTTVTLVSIAKNNLGNGGVYNIEKFGNYVGGTTSTNRSITTDGTYFYIKVNEATDATRQIYKFLKTDIASDAPTLTNHIVRCCGRFSSKTLSNEDATCTGICIGAHGDLLEVISTALNGKYISRQSIKNALWAENQVMGEFEMLTDGTAVPTAPKACMVDPSGNYWTGEYGKALNTNKLFRYDTDGTVHSSAVTNKNWVGIMDLCTDTTNVFILGKDSEGSPNYEVYYGTLDALNDLIEAGTPIALGSTWGTLITGMDTNKKVLTGIAHHTVTGTLYFVNDTDDKIGTISTVTTPWDTVAYDTLDLPAPSNTQWGGIGYYNSRLFIVDNHTGTTFDKIYVLNVSKCTASAWYREHIYQDPDVNAIAASNFGIDFDSLGNMVLTNTGHLKFYKMTTVEVGDALQVNCFLDSNNVLLSNNVSCATEIKERYFEPEDYADIRDCPDKYYCAVGYGDNGISILNLDEYLSERSSSGYDRYTPSNIRTYDFENKEVGIIGLSIPETSSLFIEKDILFSMNKSKWNSNVIIDSTDNVGRYSSIAVDSNGYLHISYYDFTGANLEYATNITGSWVITTLDSTDDVGKWTSIVVDSNDYIHICYYDTTNTKMKYATNLSGSFDISDIDATGGKNVGSGASMLIDTSDNLHISYWNVTDSTLKYATTVVGSGSWSLATVNCTYVAAVDPNYSSICISSTGKIYIAFKEVGSPSTKRTLRLVTNSTGSWVSSNVTSTLLFRNADSRCYSMAIDTSDNLHVVGGALIGGISNNLGYWTNATGSFVEEVIDVANTTITDSPTIAIDSRGYLHVVVSDNSANTLCHYENSTGSWVKTIIDTTVTMSAVGQYGTSVVINDDDNNLYCSYYDVSNGNLKFVEYINNGKFVIPLKEGKAYKVENILNEQFWDDTLSNRNDGVGFVSTLNTRTQLSSQICNSIYARTFSKDDVSDYKGKNKKTFVLIGTDGGCDLMIIDWDNDDNRTISRVIKNLFSTTTIGSHANWIAPDGTVFTGDYASTGKMYKSDKKVWNINAGSITKTEIGTSLLAGKVFNISENSRFWYDNDGTAQYRLVVGTLMATDYEIAIVNVNAGTLESIYATNTSDVAITEVNNFEDKLFAIQSGAISTTETQGWFKEFQKMHFDDDSNNLLLNDYHYDSISEVSRPKFTAYTVDAAGKTRICRYTPTMNIATIGSSTKGLQLFFYPELNASLWKSEDKTLILNPRQVHYLESKLLEDFEKSSDFDKDDSDIVYTDGTGASIWSTGTTYNSINWASGNTAGYATWSSIVGYNRIGLHFEKNTDCGKAKIKFENVTTSTIIINNEVLDLYSDSQEDFVYWISLSSLTDTYRITITHDGTKNALASDYFVVFYGAFLIEALTDASVTATLTTWHTDDTSDTYAYTLTDDTTTHLAKQKTFSGDGANKNFALATTHHAYEPYRISKDSGTTWLYPESYLFTWGSVTPFINEACDADGYFTLVFADAPAAGTNNVIIQYVPKIDSYDLQIQLNLSTDGVDYYNYRKGLRLTDFGLEFIK